MEGQACNLEIVHALVRKRAPPQIQLSILSEATDQQRRFGDLLSFCEVVSTDQPGPAALPMNTAPAEKCIKKAS